jgi:hypothetical protein
MRFTGTRTLLGVALGGLTWSLSPSAFAGDIAAKAQKMIDEGDLEGAKKRCEKWGALQPEADPALREACAQVWLAAAETADTVEAWAEFRRTWASTSWAPEALKHESDLALSAVGYGGQELDYLAVYERYPDTEAAQFAYERAAEAALAAIVTRPDVVAVAQKYPSQVQNLLRDHLDAFVTATVTADSIGTIVVDPPVLEAATIQASWVAMDATKGTMTPWRDAATQQLGAYGIPADAVAAMASADPNAPAFPLCYDPNKPDNHLGAKLEGGGGRMFVAAPYAPGCGPDASPVFVTVRDGKIVALSAGPTHHVSLEVGEGTFSPVMALAGTAPPRLSAVPGGAAVIVTPAGAASIVQPLNGGDPWLTTEPQPDGHPFIPGLAALWVPPGYALAPTATGVQVTPPAPPADSNFRPYVDAWHLPPGDQGVIVSLVRAFFDLEPGSTALTPPAAPPPPWTGNAGPPGSTAVSMPRGDVKQLSQALTDVGVTTATLKSATQVDLDGDGVPELVGEGNANGRRVVALLHRPTGRVFAWLWRDPVLGTRRTAAFQQDGVTTLAWVGATIEVLRYDGVGFSLDEVQ